LGDDRRHDALWLRLDDIVLDRLLDTVHGEPFETL
jgi:hypothetical protein